MQQSSEESDVSHGVQTVNTVERSPKPRWDTSPGSYSDNSPEEQWRKKKIDEVKRQYKILDQFTKQKQNYEWVVDVKEYIKAVKEIEKQKRAAARHNF